MEEGVAPDKASASQMRAKHQSAPADRRPPPVPMNNPLQVSGGPVLQTVHSFAPGSLGGPDGLRPQHLIDLIAGAGEEESFLLILTSFINLILRGGVSLPVCYHIFGAGLFALSKPGACLRPITAGLTLRRLVAKIANRWVGAPPSSSPGSWEKLAVKMLSMQLGPT